MALFGGNKKNTGEKKAAGALHHARTHAQKDGAAHTVVHAPWFSEKALIQTEKGIYAFMVPQRATKADIAGAVKEIYNVSPKKIRIVNLPGKAKALRNRRGEGMRARRRKAYVYLHAGDTIQFA